jgi:hypothetical protein
VEEGVLEVLANLEEKEIIIIGGEMVEEELPGLME